MSDRPTILLAADPASPLLAAGVAGAMPPLMSRYEWQHPDGRWLKQPWGVGWPLPAADRRKIEGALVLALAGSPVPEGMDRARDVLATVEGINEGSGALFQLGPDFGTTYEWCRLITGAAFGGIPTWRLPSKPPCEMLHDLQRAWALATVCASRLPNTRVIVLDGAPDV